MKNSKYIMLLLTAAFMAFLLGIFVGRANLYGEASVLLEHKSPSVGKVDLNNATIDELCLLPGVSEITAQKIIDYREKEGPFRKVEDLCNISGISQGKLEQIQDFITINDVS